MQESKMSKAGQDEDLVGDEEDLAPPQDAPAEPLSRFERLKQKIKKLQTRNPDIYPMF